MPGPGKKDDGSEQIANLDTGMGGFSIGGNLQAYDVGNPDSPGPQRETPRVKTVNANVDIDPATGKHRDISKGTRLKLSNYLSNVTKGVEGDAGRPNRFVIESSYETTPQISTESNGYPGPIARPGNEWTYTDIEQGSQGTGLNSYSPAYPTIQSLMKKGAASGNKPDGHDLLIDATNVKSSITNEPGVPSFTEIRGESPIKNYTSAVLKSNRFTHAYGNDDLEPRGDGIPENGREASTYYIPSEKGKNYLRVGSSNVTSVSSNRMKSIGSALSMRASQEWVTMDMNAPANPNNAGNWLLAQLPSPEQLGIWKPESFTTNAGDVLDSVKDDSDAYEISISKRTWGALNNVNDVFTGADAVGMSLLATVLAGASIAAIQILLLTIWSGDKPEQIKNGYFDEKESKVKKSSIDKKGISAFGKNTFTIETGFIAELAKYFNSFMGIPYVPDFNEAVRLGYNNFFKPILLADGRLNDIGTLRDTSSGYYVVACRNIIRSIFVFAEYTTSLNWSSPASYLKIIDIFRNSRIFNIIHLFAKIGHQISKEGGKFDQEDLHKIFVNDSVVNTGTGKIDFNDLKNQNIDQIESIDGNYSSRIDAWQNKIAPSGDNKFAIASAIGNRVVTLNHVTPKLVWAADKTPDLMLSATYDEKNPVSRILIEEVRKVEAYLDSQYVPFYFHDLRTNEILSFHAFLDNISDSYTPTYDSSDAIGRIEPIQTYKSTQRKFGFSFFVVSTGEDDIDVMYAKINKLVTLVYPQFTVGKQIQIDNKNKYIQPFSQLVGAAPLIRIRLGDIATSNYTRYNLARLFGSGENNFLDTPDRNTAGIEAGDSPFEPKNNSIVKYFENNGGKGLAGYIDSLEFDWTNNIPWEIKGIGWDDSVKAKDSKGKEYDKSIYYRAPKMCKVSLGFMPMFDITPGLDHNGRNRAPVYQIGQHRTISKPQAKK